MSNYNVTKHNDLIDCMSHDEFTKFEQQVIIASIAKISMSDTELKDITLSIDDLYEISYGSSLKGTTRKMMIKKLDKLTDKNIIVKNKIGEDSYVKFPWFSEFNVSGKDAYVKINNRATEYILNLEDNFTTIKEKSYMLMNSGHGIRLLEIMSKIYGNVISRKFKVDELRMLLLSGTDKYKKTYDFKKKVIEPAIEEVNEIADFTLTYRQIKEGRIIKYIEFTKHYK